MKYIFTSLLMAVLLIGSSFNEIKAQNLQFNSAVFNEYGPANGNGNNYSDVVFTGQLIVNEGEVLKLTSASAATSPTISFGAAILINEKYINTGGDVWLPAGTYEIKLVDAVSSAAAVIGYISGVLYDVVP
jgi:hypothetical protein